MLFGILFQGMALFGAVRRVMSMKHAEIFCVFVFVVIPTAFLVSLLLSRRFIRLIIRRRVIQCGLQKFAEVLKVMQCSGGWFEILNLHLPLPFDGDSEL